MNYFPEPNVCDICYSYDHYTMECKQTDRRVIWDAEHPHRHDVGCMCEKCDPGFKED